MSPPLRVVLVGNESAAARTLHLLHSSRHSLNAVLGPTKKSTSLRTSFAARAEELGYPVQDARRVKEPSFAGWLREQEIDLLFNVHSLHRICAEVLEAPRIGAFNLHPGPLPENAGRNPVSWALMDDHATHGVTLHWMSWEIDCGPVAYAERFPLEPTDTAISLFGKCVDRGMGLIQQLLQDADEDKDGIPAIPQDMSRHQYHPTPLPLGQDLDWHWPAHRIVNYVRAHDHWPLSSPFGNPKATLGGREVGIVTATETGEPATFPPGATRSCDDNSIVVASADEWVRVRRVSVDGRLVRPALLLQESGSRP